jgi:hypothetical protein
MKRKSPALFVTGLVLTIVGGVALPAGGAALAAVNANDSCSGENQDSTNCAIAGTIAGVGFAAIAAGIPMMIIGGQSVPEGASSQSRPWWRPADVAFSPAGTRVTWNF